MLIVSRSGTPLMTQAEFSTRDRPLLTENSQMGQTTQDIEVFAQSGIERFLKNIFKNFSKKWIKILVYGLL